MLAYFGPLPGAVGPLLGILGGAFVFLGGGRPDSIRPDADRAVAPLITDHGPPPGPIGIDGPRPGRPRASSGASRSSSWRWVAPLSPPAPDILRNDRPWSTEPDGGRVGGHDQASRAPDPPRSRSGRNDPRSPADSGRSPSGHYAPGANITQETCPAAGCPTGDCPAGGSLTETARSVRARPRAARRGGIAPWPAVKLPATERRRTNRCSWAPGSSRPRRDRPTPPGCPWGRACPSDAAWASARAWPA